jgi:DNA polymerase II small subunit/DNA polymerase delta subunit B
MEIQANTPNKLSAIDRALAAAKARKEAKDPGADAAPKATPSKPKAQMQESIDKTAAKLAKDAAREARQAQIKVDREARRAAKAAEKNTGKPAHMKKIDRAASKLPTLNDQMQLTFNEVTTNYSAEQITALALHLQHFNRVKATERALNQKVEAGASIRIIGGDPKYIGMMGTVAKAQRIRCFVDVPGFKKPVYLFTSDVEVVVEAVPATGTDG